MDSDANAVWTHLITASSGCEQKADVNYCRKCFLIDSRKNALPRNASRQGCVGVSTCCSWCHWTEQRQQEERLLEQTSRIYSLSVAFRLVQHKGPSCDCWVEFFRFFRFPLDPMPQLKFSFLFGWGREAQQRLVGYAEWTIRSKILLICQFFSSCKGKGSIFSLSSWTCELYLKNVTLFNIFARIWNRAPYRIEECIWSENLFCSL